MKITFLRKANLFFMTSINYSTHHQPSPLHERSKELPNRKYKPDRNNSNSLLWNNYNKKGWKVWKTKNPRVFFTKSKAYKIEESQWRVKKHTMYKRVTHLSNNKSISHSTNQKLSTNPLQEITILETQSYWNL